MKDCDDIEKPMQEGGHDGENMKYLQGLRLLRCLPEGRPGRALSCEPGRSFAHLHGWLSTHRRYAEIYVVLRIGWREQQLYPTGSSCLHVMR